MAEIEEAREVCRHLVEAGFPTMFVGGCVRDRLFGIPPKDFDLATTAQPEQVSALLRKFDYAVHPIGLDHGTVGVATASQLVEITTLREDIDCDGRHAEVRFTANFAADARRRDFTINGLFEDLDGQIHDFVGGHADLEGKRLRFIGESNARIREDYLRILRYFRFLARLGWEACPEAIQAISQCRDGLKTIASERILSEMDQLLTQPFAGHALELADRCGILDILFDWYRPKGLPAMLQQSPKLSRQFPETVWFLFLWHTGPGFPLKWLDSAMRSLRFSRARQRIIRSLFELFQPKIELSQRLKTLIRIENDKALDSAELKTLLTCFSSKWSSTEGQMLEKLVAGFSRTMPPIMRKDILSLPETNRSEAILIAKIYWYLGWCGGKTQLKFMLPRALIFRSWLDSGATEPPPDTMWGEA